MRTVRVGRLAGIPIGFQPLWLVVVGLLTWSLGAEYFPDQVEGITPIAAYGLGLAAALLLFICVLLHELGHAVVARRRGVEIEEIDLWLLGGVARMKQEPTSAKDELAFAAAGPAVTALIALVLAGLLAVLGDGLPALTALIEYELIVNVILLALNMLPAFPLDGGRIARAIMWQLSGDHATATERAARVGRGFGFGMIVFGALSAASGAPGGLWLMLVGGFLLFAATAESQHVTMTEKLAGQTVGSLMTAPVLSIPAGTTALEAVSAHFMRHLFSAFPVVDDDGRALGLLTVDAVRATPAESRAGARVEDLMDADPALLLDSALPLVDAIASAAFMRHGRAVVVDSGGRPTGLLSSTDVQRWLRAADLLPPMTAGRTRPGAV